MKGKLFGLFFLALVASILALTSVLAESWQETSMPDIKEMTVYVDGNVVWYGFCYGPSRWPPIDDPREIEIDASPIWRCYTYQYNTPALERDSQLSVKVVFKSNKDLGNMKVHVWVNGYREELEARTGEFDVFKDNLYSKTLFIDIPYDIDARDPYTLYVKLEKNRELTGVDEAKVNMNVQRIANILDILSIDLYDNNRDNIFNAGSTMYADIVVKNRGNHKADDVYVRVSIKELGISRNVYLGDLEAYDNHYAHNNDDTKRVTIAMTLPTDTATGSYTVEVEVYNSELSDKETRTILVEKALAKNIEIIPQITEADVRTGATAQYSLLVSNTGETEEHFVIEVLGANGWATTVVSPASFTLEAGESKIVNIDLSVAKDAEAGKYPFTVRVKYGNEAKQYNFMANVAKGTAVDWKIILMIIGIVLAVAIIVLLVITLIKQNKGSVEEKPELESYY